MDKEYYVNMLRNFANDVEADTAYVTGIHESAPFSPGLGGGAHLSAHRIAERLNK